ncbi:hypothetical protein CLIM01_01435 [Colletotrichum limetticola]|uniref:Heterokaryon incompatibility domain-containing protein n=1 Tax=Colletotrichum limetticola TaxID=1209924 RepID=A0ABQ9QBW4_9PEZI|nr:hypothetical protein CLIM01_01435 [Colletotrichum limetticola]
MHLINVHTRLLEEFHADKPKYAILSHTWGPDKEEISFREIKQGDTDKPGIGTIKLEGCLRQAKTDGLDYVWIDTCCIDKTNANELGEAINSMFRWYQEAKTCYTFLQDVPSKDNPKWKSKFRKSRWFTRGWTLQELLAPSELMFYSSDWQALGTKLQLSEVVGDITGIPARFLLGASNLREASVAQRMSWASNRETKRVEDIAYSLLGIFNVVMSLIYGEGDGAFIRLQDTIINATTDDSILAWGLRPQITVADSRNRPRDFVGGILASSPAAFAGCGKVASRENRTPTIEGNILRGYLKLRIPLHSDRSGVTYGLLSCRYDNDGREKVIGIPLSRIAPGESGGEYVRPKNSKTTMLPDVACDTPASSIHALASISPEETRVKDCRYGFSVENIFTEGLELIDVWPTECWDKDNAFLYTGMDFHNESTQRTWARVRPAHSENDSNDFVLALELTSTKTHSAAKCHAMIASRKTTLKKIAYAPLVEEYTFGNGSAYNGIMSVQAKVFRQRHGAGVHPVYAVNVVPQSSQPKSTVNLTSEIELLDHSVNVQSIFRESQDTTPKLNKSISSIEAETTALDSAKARLRDVQRQLEQLEAEKRDLVQKKEKSEKRLESSSRDKEKYASMEKKLLQTLSTAQRMHSASGEKRASQWKDSVVTYLSEDLFKAKKKQNEAIQSMEDVLQRTFLQAVVKGNIAAMQFLKDSLPSLDFNDSKGRGVLAWAIIKKNLSVVTWLIENGASVNAKDGYKRTPLNRACSENFLPAVRLLLHRGAHTEDKDQDGRRPLHVAIRKDNILLTQWLLDRGADIEAKTETDETPLELAVSAKSVASINLLLDRGADLEAPGSYGATALCKAAKYDDSHDSAVLRVLIDRGANIKARSKDKKWTPLHYAAAYGCTEAVELLLREGADATAKSSSSVTPLMSAAENRRNSGPLRSLIDHGSSNEVIESIGEELLASAARYGCAESVKLLLNRGVSIESKDEDGCTPLANAAEEGNKKTAEVLIKQKAKVDCKDANGLTALSLAAQAGHVSLVKLLVEGGARIDRKDETDGRTALHWAVLKDRKAVIEELLERGANIEASSKTGHTAIYYAIRNGFEASFKLLLEKGASLTVEGPHGKTPLAYARDVAQKHKKIGSSPAMKGIIKCLEKQTLEKDKARIVEA